MQICALTYAPNGIVNSTQIYNPTLLKLLFLLWFTQHMVDIHKAKTWENTSWTQIKKKKKKNGIRKFGFFNKFDQFFLIGN